MALVEKLTYEERCLLEVIQHPVLFAEFIQNFDEEEDIWFLTDYQKEFMCDFNHYVSLCCARSVGKTVSLTLIILWLLINNFYDAPYIVYTVPNKVHLDPVFTNLVYLLRTNGFLKYYIDKKKGINSSTYKITLINNATLDCRIAGQTGTGENVVGMHTPHIILDESSFYPYGTWIELQPTLNTWQQGFRMIVSGVPDGRRDKSVCYYADQIAENFSKHRVSAFRNPRYTKEADEENVKKFGGRNSDDYRHLVLGEHGDPYYSVFDRSRMAIEQYPVYKLEINGLDYKEDIKRYIEDLSLIPSLNNSLFSPFIGIDLGYTDPTIILILYLDKNSKIKIHAAVTLKHTNYTIQEKVIDYIDTRFDSSVIGIDEGNIGKAVIQHLNSDASFKSKNYVNRIVPIDFGGQIEVARDLNNEPIYEKVKPFSVKVLQEYSDLHKIIYSSTYLEMIQELEKMAYTRSANGSIIYKTLNSRGGDRVQDHITSALLAGILAFYIKNELKLKENKKSLFSARWL